MPSDCISYQKSGFFSPLINDYLQQKNDLKPLYNNFPTLENFEKQIVEKKQNFNNDNRISLVASLKKQYTHIEISDKTLNNIALLNSPDTFTVTTGHQLNL